VGSPIPEARVIPRLPDELVASTTFLLKRLGYAAKDRSLAAYDREGVHPYHFAILIALDQGEHETQGSIADVLGYDRGQLVGLLDELEAKGLVERRRDPNDRRRHLVRVTADGKRTLRRLRLRALEIEDAFLAPSDQIAYIARMIDKPEEGVLKLVDGAGGQARMLSRPNENVTAFFWSPDGTRIAYLTQDGVFRPDGPRAWHIVDVADGAVRDFETFNPSPAFAALQIYFDAYTFSLSPWSPDGSRIVYGAQDGVYVLDVAAGRAFRASAGAIGMWVGGH